MNLRIFGLLSLILFAAGCGGGGGGGGGDATGVRVLHGALSKPPIELVAADETLQIAAFGGAAGYSPVDSGEQVFFLNTARSGRSLRSLTIPFEKKQRRSILFYGDGQVTLLEDAAVPDSGMAAVRLVHAVTAATALNLSANGQAVARTVSFGRASQYQSVAPGTLNYLISRNADSLRLLSGSADVAAGKAYSLLAAGEAEYFVHAELLEDR